VEKRLRVIAWFHSCWVAPVEFKRMVSSALSVKNLQCTGEIKQDSVEEWISARAFKTRII
jgi:hypothetical protein